MEIYQRINMKNQNLMNLFRGDYLVGSGYTKKDLAEFNKKLAEHWKVFNKKNPPSSIILASGFKEKPDAYIEPENSCIVQIKAAEVIDSDKFKTGFTLRFPRVEKFRDDKAWYECMTVPEVQKMKDRAGGKLAGGKVELREEEEPTKKKRKVVTHVIRPTLGAQFQAADLSDVTQSEISISTDEMAELEEKYFPDDSPYGLFRTCRFYLDNKLVIGDPSTQIKDSSLEFLALELRFIGGTVSDSLDKKVSHVMVDKRDLSRVQELKQERRKRSRKFHIVNEDWLRQCLEEGSLCSERQFEPS